MSIFMVKVHTGFASLSFMKRLFQRARAVAQAAAIFVAILQDVFLTGVADHFVAQIPGDPFGPIVPEENLPGSVHQAHATLEAAKNHSKNRRILKISHTCFLKIPF